STCVRSADCPEWPRTLAHCCGLRRRNGHTHPESPVIRSEARRLAMNRESTSAVVQRIYEMFGKGDIPAVRGCIDPNGELVFEGPSAVPWAGRYQGRDGWGVFFQRIGGNLDILGMTMEIFAA